MKALLKWIALAPLAAVLVTFAVINRQPVTVTFDPFGGGRVPLAVTAPLFVVLGVAAMIGVIAGGIATWFGQARHRRIARRARAEIERLRAENERLAAVAREKGGGGPALVHGSAPLSAA